MIHSAEVTVRDAAGLRPGGRLSLQRLAVLGLGLSAAITFAGCAGSAAAPSWTFATTGAVGTAAAARGASSAPVVATKPAMDGPSGMAAADSQQNAMAASGSQQNAMVASGTGQAGAMPVVRLDLTIVTGDMIGHTEYPAYVPSDFTLPANAAVVVTITNFDDATPLTKDMQQYATVAGTVGGTMQVTAINAGDPNGAAGPSRILTKLDPATVSHTFTIPALGINVPVAPHARTVFTIHTGRPGTYAWRCFDPCGNGPMGWGTAMAAKRGYMEGTLTVA